MCTLKIGVLLSAQKTILSSLCPILIFSKKSSYFGKWMLPEGYDTGITVYNSAVNKKVPLMLRNKGIATWYMCGPTVYAESHIGHASCYVKFDIIRRVMENMFNVNVLLLMGITDIDDKIIQRSNKVGLSCAELSKEQELNFFNDMKVMRVKPPSKTSRVTENISLIIDFCKTLIEKEYAYVTNKGNVYFMVSKGVSADVLNELPENSQLIIDPLKRDQRDFALWKSAKPYEPFWISPWGKGRPGWHVECSAMASNVFGSHLDIHSGGYDLLFPHHANEKSQSEAFHGCHQWVNYWLHAGLLQIGDDVKMSKSLNNTISIKDYLKENSVNDFRILCLQSPYRKNIFYNSETLDGAKGLHNKLHSFINECELYLYGEIKCLFIDEKMLLSKLESTKEKVVSLLADDFNTSQALLCITDLVDEVNKCLQSSTSDSEFEVHGITAIAACFNYVDKLLEMFGVNIMCKKRLPGGFICFMDAVTEFRNQIRLLALCRIKTDAFSEEKVTPYKFISAAYRSFNEKHSLIARTELLCPKAEEISKSVDVLHKQALDMAASLDDIAVNTIMDQMKISSKTKLKAPLLSFCDEMRLSLQICGIGIKDRKDVSTWFPLLNLCKM